MGEVAVLLAPGFEEIEAITVIDVLRRADVTTMVIGVEGLKVQGAHGITVEADELLEDVQERSWDLVVLPGGMPGSTNLRDDERVQKLLKRQDSQGGRLAAICAAPIALSAAGVLENRRATSYPGFGDQLKCLEYIDNPVVQDGSVTTSRGPGTALRFAFCLVAQLKDEATAEQLAQGMLAPS